MAENRTAAGVERDLLHPLATLHWEQCHKWNVWDLPKHCAVLHNRVAVLFSNYIHISSTNLHSWTETRTPCYSSSLTTYQSKFVLVGGYYESSVNPSNRLWTSTAGQNWEATLPAMPTKRWNTSSVSGGSPEVLVVAGGRTNIAYFDELVEVLLGDHWTTAASLPAHLADRQLIFHEGSFYAKAYHRYTLYTCSCNSLVASAKKKEHTPEVWKTMATFGDDSAVLVSFLSRLIKVDEYFNMTGYSNTTQTWVELTNDGIVPEGKKYNTCAAILSTGELIIANRNGVYKGTLSVSTFDPNSRFCPNVLSRLEAVMGVKIASVLANYRSELMTLSGVKLQTRQSESGATIVAKPDKIKDAIQYVKEVIIQWSMNRSHHPPTWKQLLNVFDNIGLTELSQQIKAFMRGDYKFENAYKHFITFKDVLELLCLKFMFLGPPRLGKSTTRRRVMKEIVDLNSAEEADQVRGSTGTVECCPNMLVQDKSDPATAERKVDWAIVQNLTDEARLLFHSLKDSVETKLISEAAATSLVGSETKVEVSQASSTAQSRPIENPPSQPNLLQKMMSKIKSVTKSKQLSPNSSSAVSPTQVRTAPTSADYSEIATIFKEVSGQPEFAQDVKHSFKAFLRIEDTGGQPELMDMLPVLTIGPALYLLFFSYEFKLDEEYQVFYQRDSGEKTIPEKSEFTLREMLLCMLASISCCSASTHAQPLAGSRSSEMNEILESSKSVVYIVGTHKDKVDDDYIATVDKQLQQIIVDTEFHKKGIVQFCSEDKLVVSLDNMGGGIEEIHELHQLLESAMEKHFKKLHIPAVWLLFSLCLRMKDMRTASIETCLALSKAFNMTPYETKVALWFLHHHAGVMMYFPDVAGLEDLVIIDVQVVYDSITGVILQAMSFKTTDQAIALTFRKTGCFTMEALKSATAEISGDLIPPNELIALLAHVHIIAEILPKRSLSMPVLAENKEYIMPCVLEKTSSKELDLFHQESSRSCLVAPLLVYFTCGFTPMGLFPAVMACIIANQSFTLTREGIKKNMVHFLYGSKQIRVTFISRSTYYEVVVSCDHSFKSSIHHECSSLKREIETTLKEASSRMNYSGYIDYKFAFECYIHEGENHLGIVYEAEPTPSAMTCVSDQQGFALQSRHLIWYGKKYKKQNLQPTVSGSETCLSIFLRMYPDLVNSVSLCVMDVADHYFSIGLISEGTNEKLVHRVDLTPKDKARILLDNVRIILSSTPTALKEFVSVLQQSGECDEVAKSIQKQLQDFV